MSNIVGGGLEGAAKGTSEAAGTVANEALRQVKESIKSSLPTSDQMSQAAREAFGSVGEAVRKSLPTGDDAAHLARQMFEELKKSLPTSEEVGKQSGKIVSDLLKSFWEGLGLDPSKRTEEFARQVSDLTDSFIKHLKMSKISERIGSETFDSWESFRDALNLGEVGRGIGEEARNFMKSSSKELGRGLREAVSNTAGEVLKGWVYDQLPYVLASSILLTGTPLFVYYLYYRAKYYIGTPKLATEIHQYDMMTPLTETIRSVSGRILGTSPPKPVYNPEITEKIEEVTQSVANIRKHGGYFQNVLFYGPGGTGKTMVSEYIARNSGMSYIKMSGGDLAQYIKRGEHVTELNKLMDKLNLSWRPWSTRPWILFIDEAESLCRDRSKITSTELFELQNAFLNRTGTQSNRFMIILSTNRMEDLDEAVLSRMDYKIYIGPPAEAERIAILNTYIPQFFSKKEIADFFSPAQVAQLAKKTDGLTGRALFKLLNAIANKKAATADNKLTPAIIDAMAVSFVAQEKEVEARRERKAALSRHESHKSSGTAG
jgi:MoxR-like ATPase